MPVESLAWIDTFVIAFTTSAAAPDASMFTLSLNVPSACPSVLSVDFSVVFPPNTWFAVVAHPVTPNTSPMVNISRHVSRLKIRIV